MSKPARIEFEGAWYHVTNRALSHLKAFQTAHDYEAFLQTLNEAGERYRVEVHAYCLLPHRYDLIVRTPAANLRRAMRHVNGVYTQDFQYTHGFEGPVFRGRYRAVVFDPESYLLPLSGLVHRLPLEGSQPRVSEVGDWFWSSGPVYCGLREAPSWLHVDAIGTSLGIRDDGDAYKAYLADGLDPEIEAYRRRRRLPAVLGSEPFRRRCLEYASVGEETPDASVRLFASFEDVLAATEAATGTHRATILSRGRRGGRPDTARPLAMLLCQDAAGLPLKEIGRLFDGIHYSAVAQAIRRTKRRLASDPSFHDTLQRIRDRLPAGHRDAEPTRAVPIADEPTSDERPQPERTPEAPRNPSAPEQGTSNAETGPFEAPQPTASGSPSVASGWVSAPATAPDDIMAYLDGLPGHIPDSPADPLADSDHGATDAPRASDPRQPPAKYGPSGPRTTRTQSQREGTHSEGGGARDALDVNTMLELAQSYVELGERESALELIGEITELGNAQQRHRAWRIRGGL